MTNSRIDLHQNNKKHLLQQYSAIRLTSSLLWSSRQHLVKDVEGPLIFGLASGSRLFKEVWIYMSGVHIKKKLITIIL